jgi:hypothetical protein
VACDSSSTVGEEKRTGFFGWVWGVVVEGDVSDGEAAWEDWAWAKSAAWVGSLGWVRVEVVEGEALPRNCELRSACCLRREVRVSLRLEALLGGC